MRVSTYGCGRPIMMQSLITGSREKPKPGFYMHSERRSPSWHGRDNVACLASLYRSAEKVEHRPPQVLQWQHDKPCERAHREQQVGYPSHRYTAEMGG